MSQLEEANRRLLEELVGVQRAYGDLLRTSIAERRAAIRALDLAAPEPPALPNLSYKHSPPGRALQAWLESLGLERRTVERVMEEEYTKEDLVNLLSRQDLAQLGLKFAPFSSPAPCSWSEWVALKRRCGVSAVAGDPERPRGDRPAAAARVTAACTVALSIFTGSRSHFASTLLLEVTLGFAML